MEPKDLIGKTVRYRPMNELKVRESKVVRCKDLMNLAGEQHTVLQMANGDEESASAVYFDPAISQGVTHE